MKRLWLLLVLTAVLGCAKQGQDTAVPEPEGSAAVTTEGSGDLMATAEVVMKVPGMT